VVHTVLRDWPGVRTVSVDEDPETGMKRVQIAPVGGPRPDESPDEEAAPPEDPDDEDPDAEPLPPPEA
jgi:hypothetical protein